MNILRLEIIMNINIDIDASIINDENHLINLHKHITRTATKYDRIRSAIFVNILKPMDLDLKYNKNLVHIVIQVESHDFDKFDMTQEIFDKREILEIKACLFMGKFLVDRHSDVKELTIVAGCQPDGSYIGPCIHIIYEVNNIDDKECLSDLISTVEILDEVISDM
jgi:hypothetical protein